MGLSFVGILEKCGKLTKIIWKFAKNYFKKKEDYLIEIDPRWKV